MKRLEGSYWIYLESVTTPEKKRREKRVDIRKRENPYHTNAVREEEKKEEYLREFCDAKANVIKHSFACFTQAFS